MWRNRISRYCGSDDWPLLREPKPPAVRRDEVPRLRNFRKPSRTLRDDLIDLAHLGLGALGFGACWWALWFLAALALRAAWNT